jgi:MarR family transcriptional regulator, 2-MHQ and catechol-resistance regulon repressor
VTLVPRPTAAGSTTDAGTACPSTDERLVLFGLLLETNARLERQLGAALEDAIGLPLPWFEVLLRVRRTKEGYLSMSALATQTVYSSGGTTRLIDRIEGQGLVERVACPNDRRAVHVRLTPAGDATLDRAMAVHISHLDEFVTSRLTHDERVGLESALRKLNGGPPVCATS